jgi:tripartite-type tricarboxylate transporter receptor subunit TctC
VGASGNVATTEVAKSGPDGYTLLAHSSAYAVNPTLFPNAGYDPSRDLLPIAVVARQANIVLVNSSFPARTLDELKSAMTKGKLAFASPGAGTTPHLTAENLFHVRWHADVTHVPFKGAGPAVAGLLAGEPPIGCMAGSGPMSQIKAGKLRALAVSSAQRLPQLPDVPTLDEAGVTGYEANTWQMMAGPANLPAPIVTKLNAALADFMLTPEAQTHFKSLGMQPMTSTPAEAHAYIVKEAARWTELIKGMGISVD